MKHFTRKLFSLPGFRDEDPDAAGKGAAKIAEALAAAKAAEAAAAAKVIADAEAAKLAAEELAKKDKKPVPTDAEAKLLKEVMAKKAAIDAANAALEAANAKLKEFEGIDPAAIRKLLADQEAAKTAALEAAGQWDTLKKQMNDQQQAELAARDAKVTAAETQVNALTAQISELTVGSAFANSAFIRDELIYTPTKTRKLFGDHFEAVGTKVVAYDKPKGEDGRTQLVDSKGEPLGFEDAIAKLVSLDPEKDDLLKSKAKPGVSSKTLPGVKGVKDSGPAMSGREKIAAALKAQQKA